MENRFMVTVLVLAALVVISNALPARKRMIYYQQPIPAQYYGAPQHMMYVQYTQPSANNGRSAQGASALVAGQTVATGTYLEDCNPAESDAAAPAVQHDEDVLSVAGLHSSQSVAEAYPDDSSVSAPAPPSRDLTVQIETENAGSAVADLPTEEQEVAPNPVKSDDEAKAPRVYNFDAYEPAEPAPPAAASGLPAPAPIAPVATPNRRYLASRKKVYVELDHTSAEATDVEQPDAENAIAVADDEEIQEEEEETDVAAVIPVAPKKPSARRPVAKKPAKPSKATADCSGCAKAGSSGSSSKPQIPAGTFFPISFGGTAGGAIAIANSFSTGEGGSATSHAIAYGSPDAARGRVRPSKLH